MENHVKIYEKNSKTLAVYVGGLSDLSLFTPILTVKKRKADTTIILEKIGLVSDPSTTYVFNLTPTDTSIAPGDYVYDINLVNNDNSQIHTIIRDRFSILDTVKYS